MHVKAAAQHVVQIVCENTAHGSLAWSLARGRAASGHAASEHIDGPCWWLPGVCSSIVVLAADVWHQCFCRAVRACLTERRCCVHAFCSQACGSMTCTMGRHSATRMAVPQSSPCSLAVHEAGAPMLTSSFAGFLANVRPRSRACLAGSGGHRLGERGMHRSRAPGGGCSCMWQQGEMLWPVALIRHCGQQCTVSCFDPRVVAVCGSQLRCSDL